MARILLGVSGGIAAYKSLELARLATLAGHGVRVLMTETATRFVGAASFEGIVGAPVLTSEFTQDPMRGAFPGNPQPGGRRHSRAHRFAHADNCSDMRGRQMTQIDPTPRPPRNVELALLVLALAVGIGANALVGVDRAGSDPSPRGSAGRRQGPPRTSWCH